MDTYVHKTAEVNNLAQVGEGTKVWNNVQIRENAIIGKNCILSKDVYVDVGVHIGSSCKVQNGVSIYAGVYIEDEVFIGPNACFTNDLFPRATNYNWEIVTTHICKGASIGANATIVCGNNIGKFAMIGAGSVVINDVPEYALMVGNPARLIGYVDEQGNRVPSDPK